MVLRAGTYVMGISAAISAVWRPLGTLISAVRRNRRNAEVDDGGAMGVSAEAWATRAAASSSMRWRWP